MKTRFKILLGFLVALVLVFLTFAILFASESAVSCEAENEIVDLEKRIEVGDILSTYFTVLKSKEFRKGRKKLSVVGIRYQMFTITCPFSKNSSTEYTLPFIFNIFHIPIQAEMHTLFEAADFLKRDIPFHAANFPAHSSLKQAGEAFILSKPFSKRTLTSYLTAHGFYVHSVGLNGNGDHIQGFIENPYLVGTVLQKIGVNASPNRPPFICITYSGDGRFVTSVEGYGQCDFDWSLYVAQARQFMNEDVTHGETSN